MIDEEKLIENLRPYYDKVLHQNISDDEKLAKHDMISDVMHEIRKQPKVGEWIPCSERMPEKHVDVLVTFKDRDIVIAWYSEINKQWKNSATDIVIKDNVIAWKLLPEPYHE